MKKIENQMFSKGEITPVLQAHAYISLCSSGFPVSGCIIDGDKP